MSFWVVSGYHGLFGVNDYTHLLPGFLSGDCCFATFKFWASHRLFGSYWLFNNSEVADAA
jgi:hypothetical protein